MARSDPQDDQHTLQPELVRDSNRAFRSLVLGAARLPRDATTCPVLCVSGGADRNGSSRISHAIAVRYGAEHYIHPERGRWIIAESVVGRVAPPVIEWLHRVGVVPSAQPPRIRDPDGRRKVKLYRLAPGETDRHPGLAAAMTRPIRWELIAQQYDQMIKYATAIRTGTASTEAILRRFTRTANHPTYQAMLELGRAQKTTFVARYLRSRELQREINSGLNVVESWNRANSVIAYGKGGGLATNRRDEQEMILACLRILQSALVYVNTLMLQDVLDDPGWSDTLDRDADRRGPSQLFWSHVLPYGEVRLDMARRLALTG